MKKENIILAVVSVVLVGIFVYSLFFSTPVYTVTFNTNGGSEVSEVEVRKYEKVAKPEDPTKEGYTFLGWVVNGQDYDFDEEVTGDTELEAKWEEIITSTTTTKKITKKAKKK